LRREARKPVDMGVREHLMHILRINSQEIPRLPPHFNATQMLSDDEIVDILLFGTPKSWQQEMGHQGLDPLASAPHDAAAFIERIEMPGDFDRDKKTTKVVPGKSKKTSGYAKGNSDADGSKHCMLHGNNNTHDASECKTLMAQAKKLVGWLISYRCGAEGWCGWHHCFALHTLHNQTSTGCQSLATVQLRHSWGQPTARVCLCCPKGCHQGMLLNDVLHLC